MNNNPCETKRLADAVAGVAVTIAEIIDARVQKLGEAMEQRTSMRSEETPPSIEAWVGKKEAGEHLKVSQRTLYSWMEKRWVPYMRIGSSVRFELSDVDEGVNRRLRVGGRWGD